MPDEDNANATPSVDGDEMKPTILAIKPVPHFLICLLLSVFFFFYS